MPAQRAYEVGMVNRVVPRDALEQTTLELAESIATMPPFGLALTKKAINEAEDAMGMRAGIELAFSLHHVAHAHNAEVTQGDHLGGQTVESLRRSASAPPPG
jgi:enoyl-CoA hydratase